MSAVTRSDHIGPTGRYPNARPAAAPTVGGSGSRQFDMPSEVQEGTPADGFLEEAAARCGYQTGRYPNTFPRRPTPVGEELLTGLGIKGGGYSMPVVVSGQSRPTDDSEGAVARCGYHSPTPLRRYSTLAARDLMPCEHTGPGITTALCLPVEAGGRGNADLTPQYLDELRQDGIQMTKFVYMALINAYSRLGNFDMTRQVVLDNEVSPKYLSEVKSALVRALASNGKVSDGLKQSGGCLEPKAAVALTEHAQTEGELDRLYQLLVEYLDELRQDGIQMTKFVYMALINAYSRLGNFDMTRQVVLDNEVSPKYLSEVKSALVRALASNGKVSDGLKQSGGCLEPKAAVALTEHAQTEGELDRLYQLLVEVSEPSMWFDGCSRVLQYCVQHNHSDAAVDLLRQLKERNEMSAYTVVDQEMEPVNLDVGMELFHAVKELGLNVSRTSLDFLLSACVKEKDSQRAQQIWTEYKSSGLPQNVPSSLRMYQALFSSGQRQAARKLFQKKIKDDPHARCIIDSCKMECKVQGCKHSAVIRPSPGKKVLGDSFICGDKGATQIFVKLCGKTISLQKNLTKLDTNMLIEAVCLKAGVKSNNLYSTFAGKVLEPNQLLSCYKIQKDSIIGVTPRLRGGCSNEKNWDQAISDLHDRFHTLTLPQDLVDKRRAKKGPVKVKHLADDLKFRCSMVLIHLSRNHFQGNSYGGAFTAQQILFDSDGNVRFVAVQQLKYSKTLAFRDYKTTEEIFDKAFKDADNTYPILGHHLLSFLSNPPLRTDPQSVEVITFVTNHGLLLSHSQRIAVSGILDLLIQRLDVADKAILESIMPILLDWMVKLQKVPAMKDTYEYHSWYDKNGDIQYPYTAEGTSLVRFSNNFFKHTPQFTLAQLDAAFSVQGEECNFIPHLIYDTLVTFKESYKLAGNPVPDKVQEFVDEVIGILGNNTLGCKKAKRE